MLQTGVNLDVRNIKTFEPQGNYIKSSFPINFRRAKVVCIIQYFFHILLSRMVFVSTKSKLKPFVEASEKRINGKICLTSYSTSVLLEFCVYSRERKLLLIFKEGEIEGSGFKIFHVHKYPYWYSNRTFLQVSGFTLVPRTPLGILAAERYQWVDILFV